MLTGTAGFCPDCGDERPMMPADDAGFEFCCMECDGAVLLIELEKRPRARRLRQTV